MYWHSIKLKGRRHVKECDVFLFAHNLSSRYWKKKLVEFANIQVKKKKKEVLKVPSKRIVQTSAEAVRLHHRETNRD